MEYLDVKTLLNNREKSYTREVSTNQNIRQVVDISVPSAFPFSPTDAVVLDRVGATRRVRRAEVNLNRGQRTRQRPGGGLRTLLAHRNVPSHATFFGQQQRDAKQVTVAFADGNDTRMVRGQHGRERHHIRVQALDKQEVVVDGDVPVEKKVLSVLSRTTRRGITSAVSSRRPKTRGRCRAVLPGTGR